MSDLSETEMGDASRGSHRAAPSAKRGTFRITRSIPIRRLCFVAAALIFAGTSTNLALAWGFAYLQIGEGYSRGESVVAGDTYVGVGRLDHPGLVRAYWQPGPPVPPGQKDLLRTMHPKAAIDRLPHYIPSWSGFGEFLNDATAGGEQWVIGAGWPWPALSCTFLKSTMAKTPAGSWDYTYETKGGIGLRFRSRQYPSATVYFQRALPLRPIAVGFAGNTLLFGAIWGGLWGLYLLCIKAYRRRRGLCPACGYNLLSKFAGGCPECGWSRMPGAEGEGTA